MAASPISCMSSHVHFDIFMLAVMNPMPTCYQPHFLIHNMIVSRVTLELRRHELLLSYSESHHLPIPSSVLPIQLINIIHCRLIFQSQFFHVFSILSDFPLTWYFIRFGWNTKQGIMIFHTNPVKLSSWYWRTHVRFVGLDPSFQQTCTPQSLHIMHVNFPQYLHFPLCLFSILLMCSASSVMFPEQSLGFLCLSLGIFSSTYVS